MTVNLIFHDRYQFMNGNGTISHFHSMGRIILPSFVSVSEKILQQLSANELGFSLGIFHRGIQFSIINTETFHTIKSEWCADPGFFLLGLVDSYLGASLSFTTYMDLHQSFWDRHFPSMLEDACNHIILKSVHDS